MNRPCTILLTLGLGLGVLSAAPTQKISFLDSRYTDPELIVRRSDPPTFEISLKRAMPTPGWKMKVDSVDIDEDAQRIVVRITEVRPTQPVGQVITGTRVKIELGSLPAGIYFLEIWSRPNQNSEHRPTDSLVIAAS